MFEYCENSLSLNGSIRSGYISKNVELGFPIPDHFGKSTPVGVKVGKNPTIRSGTVIYEAVTIGDDFKTGHNVLIREKTYIGNNVSIGSGTIIDGHTKIANNVNVQSLVYMPKYMDIRKDVFIGPRVTFTNDMYPPSPDAMATTVVESRAVIGAGAVILPGLTIGELSFVAAGALVTHDVPERMMAIGSPARFVDLPETMRSRL